MVKRLQIEAELRQSQKLEAVGRLASGVAHEINTPVQFVSDSIHFVGDAVRDLFGVLEKLGVVQRSVLAGTPSRDAAVEAAEAADAAELPYLAENVPKAVERALDGLGRVATIVRSMKDFAHPDQKDMTTVNLNQAVQSTLTVATHEYKYVADLETDFGVLPPVRCYAGDLNQVVLNIVVNAAHAIGDVTKGTDSRGRIHVRTYQDGDDVVVSIGDTGGGIPEDVRGHVFDPFFTTTEVGKGTGQGLFIARSVVVEKHGGLLSFETEMGKGTTFFIRLPIGGRNAAGMS
jgi:two-component system NtrC family sensor kinase